MAAAIALAIVRKLYLPSQAEAVIVRAVVEKVLQNAELRKVLGQTNDLQKRRDQWH